MSLVTMEFVVVVLVVGRELVVEQVAGQVICRRLVWWLISWTLSPEARFEITQTGQREWARSNARIDLGVECVIASGRRGSTTVLVNSFG